MRVAVALVAGQATLCAVIGWVTFGPGPATTAAGGAAAQQAAPAVLPAASAFQPAAPLPPPPRRSTPARDDTKRPDARDQRPAEPDPKPAAATTPARTTAAPRPEPTTAPAQRPTLVVEQPQDDPPAPPAPPQPPPTEGTGLQPGPTATMDLPVTVEVGAECPKEGDRGRTPDGRTVRCTEGDDGELRWQIV